MLVWLMTPQYPIIEQPSIHVAVLRLYLCPCVWTRISFVQYLKNEWMNVQIYINLSHIFDYYLIVGTKVACWALEWEQKWPFSSLSSVCVIRICCKFCCNWAGGGNRVIITLQASWVLSVKEYMDASNYFLSARIYPVIMNEVHFLKQTANCLVMV